MKTLHLLLGLFAILGLSLVAGAITGAATTVTSQTDLMSRIGMLILLVAGLLFAFDLKHAERKKKNEPVEFRVV